MWEGKAFVAILVGMKRIVVEYGLLALNRWSSESIRPKQKRTVHEYLIFSLILVLSYDLFGGVRKL